MKEIIKHINGVAGRVVTVTGLTETTMTRDNVLGVLNGTQNEVLYVPMFYGDLQSVTYAGGTLTITLASSVPAIAAGDKLFVKLYTDEDSGGGDPLLRQFFDITGAFTANEVTEQEAIDVQQEVLDDVWPDCPVGSNAAAWAARRNWADDTEADVRYYNSTIGLQCSPIPVNGPVVYNGYRFYPDGTYESIE